ncbi:MAG: 2-oxo acid dehydrogenase subunit E2, partial [Spirochaetes bacterium]|nr:2-oxo acid dehydrogenase subunit E2 [Spirochaetota bacterium]
QARKELNRRVPEKVSFNAFLIKFVAEALHRHPMVNAGWEGDHILQYGRADIGLAVAQPDGLITPIVRDCWNRGILSIDAELKVLIEKTKNNKLKLEEFTGATFTITNLGSYGIHDFTAVINPPGSAILAVGEARREPVVGDDDEIEIRTNTVLSLSCDHRVIDGAEGALFMQDLRGMMENPIQVLY